MNFLEKDIEELVYNSLINNPKILKERGLNLYPNCIRQLQLGSYGIADLICYDVFKIDNGYFGLDIQIVELKKEKITKETLFQAFRYEAGLTKYIIKNFDKYIYTVSYEYILIGKELEKSIDFSFCTESLKDRLDVYKYSLSLNNGITFEKIEPHEYKDEHIPIIKNNFRRTFANSKFNPKKHNSRI